MTDREAVHVLLRTNRFHALLRTPIMTDEQVQTWSQALRNGLIALAQSGYSLRYAEGPLRPHYMFCEPAENLSF